MQLIATQSFAHESDFDVNEESAGSVLSIIGAYAALRMPSAVCWAARVSV